MKLIFSKDEEESIILQLSTGTITEEFSYVEMLKSLLEHNEFEEIIFDDSISEADKEKINQMLDRIVEIIAETKENNSEN